MSTDPQIQEPSALPPETPMLSQQPALWRPRTSALTRGDKWWAVGFVVFLVGSWSAAFLATLQPSKFGMLFLLGGLGFWIVPLGFLFAMFVVTLGGPWGEKRSASAGKAFCARLTLLITAGAAWILAAYICGGPMGAGRLCGAKWGIGLEAIRRLQSSREVAALATGDRVGAGLEPVPSYVDSTFWGTPDAWVDPQPSGPPIVMLQWGGGFYSWGIAAGPAGECPLSDSYVATLWDEGVWVFVQP